jgi:CheY-like chemotaxis protein
MRRAVLDDRGFMPASIRLISRIWTSVPEIPQAPGRPRCGLYAEPGIKIFNDNRSPVGRELGPAGDVKSTHMDEGLVNVNRDKRVLLVDDDPLGRRLVVLQLRNAGFDVDTAKTAEEALVAARDAPPDAIVSDIRMPGMDGFQLCQEIRRDARLSHIPVLLLSAVVVDEHEQRRANDLSAKCFLRTPGLREAIEALSAALGGAA